MLAFLYYFLLDTQRCYKFHDVCIYFSMKGYENNIIV